MLKVAKSESKVSFTTHFTTFFLFLLYDQHFLPITKCLGGTTMDFLPPTNIDNAQNENYDICLVSYSIIWICNSLK